MSRTHRRPVALAAAAALVLTVTACGVQPRLVPGPVLSGEQSADASGTASTEHDDADVRFARLMIVHHEGAIEMAGRVAEDAATAEVRDLGRRIAGAQGPEIELMQGWLRAWGEDAPGATDMGGMHHGGMEMEGMDQDEAMAELDDLSGVELDRRFLELMTAHHEGAVEMAREELAQGRNPQALDLARAVVDDQTAEIAVMAGLLADL